MEVMRARFEPHKMPDMNIRKDWFLAEGKKQMENALNNIYKVNFVLDVPEWPRTERNVDVPWPVEFFGDKTTLIEEVLQTWKFLWPHYRSAGNEAKFFFDASKIFVNPKLPLKDCPVKRETIKIACSFGSDISIRIVSLEDIRIK